LERKGVSDLTEAETQLTNRDLSENEELTQLREELAREKQTFLNTEEGYLRQIRELRENAPTSLSEEQQEKLTNYEDLEIERDELKRDKLTLEQEVLAINNRLNLKQQEVNNKDNEIQRIKKEKSDQATDLNKKLKDLKKEKTESEKTLNKKLEDLQKKYSKRSQQLDEEQCENNKLTEKIEQLETKIRTLGGTP
jgi:chromosome segregation ATPase